MSGPETGEPPVETDSRFPSGPWKGFFLQPVLPGRHWMELHLTFRDGRLNGEGRDWVGLFLMTGRYDLQDGRCWWTKAYIGRHELEYDGYNEGKGIWGRWQQSQSPSWHGGFHIWPVGQGIDDPTRLTEAVETPAPEESLAL
jgi:hypothetical protein